LATARRIGFRRAAGYRAGTDPFSAETGQTA
jgi:hypothetical protein